MVEQLHPGVSARNAQVCLFDFDGTISLIRSGWMEVMIPMRVETLADLDTGESVEQLRAMVEESVGRLTGKQTIYQMIEFADQVRGYGGKPLDPLEYKRIYLGRLHRKIRHRLDDLAQGASPEKYLVPGARAFLEALRARSLKLYLASGTDQEFMRHEARLLDVDRYFDGGVYGALDDYKSFSKKILIQRVIASAECRGDQISKWKVNIPSSTARAWLSNRWPSASMISPWIIGWPSTKRRSSIPTRDSPKWPPGWSPRASVLRSCDRAVGGLTPSREVTDAVYAGQLSAPAPSRRAGRARPHMHFTA